MQTTAKGRSISARPSRWPRKQIARPIDHSAVQVVLGIDGPVVGGPWPYVTDLPNPYRDLIGPPPGYLALAGWAT